jgi:hypothetical protein
MKYLLILLLTLITLPTIWAYWGGKQSSILKKDNCPKWDYTKSYYDNSCWVVNKAIVERAKIKINRLLVKNKYSIIELFMIQERARRQTTTNPYNQAILEYIIKRVAQIV